MKKGALRGISITLLYLLINLTLVAQEKFKFGDAPLEDVAMTVYPSDTSAVAAVLYEDCDVWYDFKVDDLWLNTNYTIRIKILKSEGLDRGDFSLSYYYSGSTRESISGISGYTYNINESNGKIERTKLTKEYIFDEKTSDTRRRKKITFPNVKVGSIIELEYEKSSPFYTSVDDFIFQSTIPVRYSRYRVTIPEYFQFSKNTMGFEPIKYSETTESLTLLLGGGQRHNCTAKRMLFETFNLPALKNDDYVWNKYDFMSRVNLELAGVSFPGVLYKSFSTTWEDIDKLLLDHEDFGRQFRYSNLLKDEMGELLKPEMKNSEKISAILQLVKDKVTWNDENTLMVESVKDALKNGKGSSGDMNALLICLLKDAGFDAYPVVMSLRDHGRLFIGHPSLKSLNYFIVGVNIDGNPAYIDASSKYGDINVIPVNCMVQQARPIQKDKVSKWVDLQNTKKNSTISNQIIRFNSEGVLTGKVQKFRSGVARVIHCLDIDKEKDIDAYKNKIESNLDIKISEYEVSGNKQPSSSTKELYSFENQNITLGDEHIYMNPLIFPFITENPFKAETRVLPVEFSYPYEHSQTITIYIPDGYIVDEIPTSEKVSLNDGDITYSYLIKNTDKAIQVSQVISVKRTIYSSLDYKHLRDFWAFITNKNTSQVVLKRVTQ